MSWPASRPAAKAAIRLSLVNACKLWGLGVLGCVGVEEYPFYFAGWDLAEIERQSRELVTVHPALRLGWRLAGPLC